MEDHPQDSSSNSIDTTQLSSSEPHDQPRDLPQPLPPLRFTYELPPISEKKLALIKLVAKYKVLDPKQIEARDFDFLDESHSLHSLFQSFVEQYKLIAGGAKPLEGEVLKRAIRRAAEARSTIAEPKRGSGKPIKLEAKQLPAEVFASIDWQDFVVLETVEFFSADLNGTSNLSAPFTKSDMELRKESHTAVSEPVFKSPITGEMVPASQYNDHIRILTLDPSYEKQKAKEAERQASTNLDMDNVAENLERLRAKRRKLLEEEQI